MSTPLLVQPPSLLPEQIWRIALVNSRGMVDPTSMWGKVFISLAALARIPVSLRQSHATRLTLNAQSYPEGSTFYETDRGVTYVVRNGAWAYYLGVWTLTQVELVAIPAGDLDLEDANLLAYVSDFNHLLIWNVTAWDWAPGEMGSGMQLTFPDAAARTPDTGWQVCDGSTVQVLNPDGTYDMITVPVVGATTFYRQ